MQQQPGAQGAEPAICAQLAERGILQCSGAADLCPDECTEAIEQGEPTSATVAAGFQTSCTTLLELTGGCAHEISAAHSGGRSGTRVSDVCPVECSGRGGCAETAVDVPFLGATQDLSGHQNTVEALGGACVDGGGVAFSGAGHAEIALDSPYATDTTFSIGMWVLVAPAELFAPGMAMETQTLYSHPATFPHRGIRILTEVLVFVVVVTSTSDRVKNEPPFLLSF